MEIFQSEGNVDFDVSLSVVAKAGVKLMSAIASVIPKCFFYLSCRPFRFLIRMEALIMLAVCQLLAEGSVALVGAVFNATSIRDHLRATLFCVVKRSR